MLPKMCLLLLFVFAIHKIPGCALAPWVFMCGVFFQHGHSPAEWHCDCCRGFIKFLMPQLLGSSFKLFGAQVKGIFRALD